MTSKKDSNKSYFLVLMIALTIIYIVDEIASGMNSAMQPYVLIDLFKIPGGSTLSKEYAEAVAKATFYAMPGYCFMFLNPFYKALADKLGRKPFLILNTAIMGLGLLVCFIAPSYLFYAIGVLMVTFVQSNDMQVMYIMETAPKEHRGKLCSITKGIALASVSLIGVFRSLLYKPENLSTWRPVFLIPGILGVAVAVCCIPFVKETPLFLEKKEELANKNKEEENKSENKTGVIEAFKFMFKNKQMRTIVFTGFIFCIATGVTSYYSTILSAGKDKGLFTQANLDAIMIIFPLVNALVTFFSGFISDKLGRKKSCLVLCGISAIGLLTFVLGCYFGFNYWIVAIGYGVFIGGLWSVSDTVILVMSGESTPTELRSSVYGANGMVSGIGMLVGIIVMVAGMNIVGAENVGLLSLVATFPFMILAMIMMMKNIKETSGADMNAIERE